MPPRLSTRGTGLLPGPCWDRGQWKSLAEAGWGACSREPGEVGRQRQAKPCKSRGSEPSALSLLFHQPSLKRHKSKNKMIKNFKTVMLCSTKPQVQGPVEQHWSHAQETILGPPLNAAFWVLGWETEGASGPTCSCVSHLLVLLHGGACHAEALLPSASAMPTTVDL